MSKLSRLGHWLWMETRLIAPPLIQRTIISRLHKAKELARVAAHPHLTLYQWQGQNASGPLTVTYAGLGYVGPILQNLLFSTEPSVTKIGQISGWQPQDDLNSVPGDITILEAGKHLIQKLPVQQSIILPSRLQFILDLRGTWAEVESRFRRDARRNEVSKVKKFGYTYEISQRKADLDMFYQDMYLPTIQNRHGHLAVEVTPSEAQQLLRHGLLFLLKRDGRYVAGGLCFIEQGILRFKEMGVLNGDEQLMREGAVGAMNYLRIHWAHQAKCRGVNFGECWPYLSGLFQAKRKWGTMVSVPHNEHKQVWIHFKRNTPAVSQFLIDNPCTILKGNGDLYGMIVTPDSEHVTDQLKEKWHKLYTTPGLQGLLICSPTQVIEQSVNQFDQAMVL